MQAKEAHAVRCIVAYAGVKEAAYLVEAERVIEELDAFRREDIHRFVLAGRQLTTVVADGRHTTQQKE